MGIFEEKIDHPKNIAFQGDAELEIIGRKKRFNFTSLLLIVRIVDGDDNTCIFLTQGDPKIGAQKGDFQTSQKFPTVGSQTKGLKKNEDGSYDIYFSPKPPEGFENNWLATVPGKGWFVALRMYGPLEPWIEKTWRPGEIELVQ